MKANKTNEKNARAKAREKDAERLFREIGLEREEDRNHFKELGSGQDISLDYEIRFSNNTKTNNG